MSLSNCEAGHASLHERIEAVSTAVAGLDRAGKPSAPVSQEDVCALLTAATRLYTAHADDPYGTVALGELRVTPTEACTVAAALLRSQSLTPFEFSIWFSSR